MIYGERIQKNPCLSVEYIYNRKNVFYTVISYGDKNDSGYAFMRDRG